MIFDVPNMNVPAVIRIDWLKSLTDIELGNLVKHLMNDVEYAKNMQPRISSVVKQRQSRLKNIQHSINKFKLEKLRLRNTPVGCPNCKVAVKSEDDHYMTGMGSECLSFWDCKNFLTNILI